MNYVYYLIDLCQRDDVKYHHQCLIVLETKPVECEGKHTSNVFGCNRIVQLVAVERPKTRGQVYVADGLRTKYHFSCPTCFLPSLIKSIQQSNNNELKIVFIPRTTDFFMSDTISICNDIVPANMLNEDEAKLVYNDILQHGDSATYSSLASSGKRSHHSSSMGLQTMYAHQHHIARYSMLSHSFPHVPCVKNLPKKVLESVVNVYNHVVKVLDDRFDKDRHPFQIRDSAGATKVDIAERLKLRDALSKHFKHNLVDCQLAWPANDIMFEACTVQPTDALGFHQDLMNCSSMDKTFACLVPSATGTTETTKSAKREEEKCTHLLIL
jgi:hypothetical protein